jgi:hypothetical protein
MSKLYIKIHFNEVITQLSATTKLKNDRICSIFTKNASNIKIKCLNSQYSI